ncbi:MAG: 16S rRNA (cytidine(1402)-2'-O)-methyltransferase [Polyangiaceae bacterium]|nr:16S rRNA (cytidine(1402)-2'-O)-methyltransferase [Polyangiaceae bacterium]
MAGTLFVVGTPIGNLSDITLRAVETLRGARRIAVEDTRRTRMLLSHLGIARVPLHVLEAHALDSAIQSVVEHLVAGDDVALVTDAGMPTVSDPGARLVRATTARGLPVRVVPGPSAVTAAAAVSGLVDGPFWFAGFLPRRGTRRDKLIARIAEFREPVLLFEAPQRTQATVNDLARVMPTRRASVCRELTKLYEETTSGTLEQLGRRSDWRGEVCIVLGSWQGNPEQPRDDDGALDARIAEGVRQGATTKTLVARLGPGTALSRRELYARIEAERERQGRG